ncbi:MAG TPA: SRPBCC family protein [Conexibacter sp.]|nr:SRPBCC family protein [Conexibacter sp.]
MRRARAALELPANAAAVERLWADPAGWAAFVDGFERVVEVDPEWPAVGARLVWASHPGGRGEVTEKVLRHEPGAELVTQLSDPDLTGVQRLAFAPPAGGAAGVGVALELEYALRRNGPFMVLADPLFVRRALRDSLRRTLARLAAELGR